MDFFKNMTNRNRAVLLIGVVAAVILVFLLAIFFQKKGAPEPETNYDYNMIEQQIADSVKEYLSLYFELSDEKAAQAANVAVENYNIIMDSGVDAVNDEHTDIIKRHIRKEMLILIEEAHNLTEDELDGLASGITEIIWSVILSQIEDAAEVNNYKQEYLYLSESIQKQIDDLAEQKMKIHISANIKDKDDDSIDAASLLAAINEMTDDDLQKLAAALGLSPEELQKLINANNLNLDKELEEKLAGLKKELSDELLKKYSSTSSSSAQNGAAGQNGTNGKDGKNGTNGKDGKNGTNGKDGKNGEDGMNGKTTYIAYADDMDGAGFSLTPTETSKYVGTCITDADKQPTDYKSYENWQIYRTYIITTTMDENGVTTVHIN